MKKELYYDLGDDEYVHYVDDKDIYAFIVEKFSNEYTIHKDIARNIIEDMDLWESLERMLEEDILYHWHDEAMRQREEGKMSKYSLYGLKESDFH